MERQDDFTRRREHLKDLTEKQIEERFWALCSKLMNPVVDLAYKHTSPSIERSVLLRMGFSSIECKSIVQGAIDRKLIQHGVGHLVYKLSQSQGMDIRDAGLKLADNELWEETSSLFQAGE